MIIVLRGGGDLASGVALRLFRAGLKVLITELPRPTMVRRLVSFAEAIYQGEFVLEGVTGRKAGDLPEALQVIRDGKIPVVIDSGGRYLEALKLEKPHLGGFILVDARMRKEVLETDLSTAALIIGLGPGFIAGKNCHAVIETNRGHRLGRVLWQGAPEADTGIPDQVIGRAADRVLRSPARGVVNPAARIGDHLEPGQLVGTVSGAPIVAPFAGVLRGLVHPEVEVSPGMKVGDVDPRDDPSFCELVSEKSLAVGGAVLEAILTLPDIRQKLWS